MPTFERPPVKEDPVTDPLSTATRRTDPFHWKFTAPLFMGSALNPVNSSLIATALVPIAVFLHIPAGRTAVLVSSLYLACAVAQPTGGKLSEVFGPRRVFLCGIALVFAGGVVGGLAQSMAMLIVSRVVIGIGTSAGYPSAMLMIRRRAQSAGLAAPPGGVLGGLQIAATVTVALGLPIGGVLVEAFGWRSVFYANLPIALIALALALVWLPADEPLPAMTAREVMSRIDLGGIVAFAGMMTSLLVFIDGLPTAHWLWLAIGAVLIVVLVAWELRAKQPFIDMRLLVANAALTRTYVRLALMALCVYTVLYGLTQWLEVARGVSTEGSGLLILPMAGLSAFVIGPIARRNLVRVPLIAAAVSCAIGSLGLLLVSTTTSLIWIIVITLIFGVTLATFASGNQTALYRQALPEQIGTASGLLRTFAYVGSIGSSAIISVTFHKSVTDHGLHTVAAIMIGVSIVALLFTLADRRLGRGAAAAREDERHAPPSAAGDERRRSTASYGPERASGAAS
jgi:MFS family permease